jgi:hypothetical protein
MIFDKTLLLSNQQAITATAASTNVIDTLQPGTVFKAAAALVKDLGLGGGRIPFLIQVTEAFAAAGAATLAVELQADDDEAFGSPTAIWNSGAIGKAALIVGYRFPLISHLPRGMRERFFRLNYTVATGPMTAGKIMAGVVGAVQDNPL